MGLTRVTLSDSRVVSDPSEVLQLDPDTYHVYWQNEDVTELLDRRQKLAIFPDFDARSENFRVSAEHGAGSAYGVQPLEESTAEIFAQQVILDPLAAPGEALANTVNNVVDSVAFKKGVGVLIIGIIIFVAFKRSK